MPLLHISTSSHSGSLNMGRYCLFFFSTSVDTPSRSNCHSTLHNNNNNNNRIQRRNSRFLTISSLCHDLSPTHTLKWLGRNRVLTTRNTSSAYHVQHVNLLAMWYEGTAQLLSFTEFKSHLFEPYFIGRTIRQ